jgi:hypothetical protein
MAFLVFLKLMKNRQLFIWCIIWLVPAVIIRLYSAGTERVENGYSTVIYPPLAAFLRHLTGWLPFSIGDILYGLFGAWIIWKLFRGIRAIFKKQVDRQKIARASLKTVIICLLLYVIFNAFWGINYNRKGIADQLHLQMDTFSISDLKNMNGILLEKVNLSKKALINGHGESLNTRQIFAKVQDAYSVTEKQYPFLQYHTMSLKPSLWGWLGNYLGFTGYYNPFTGEAQVNTTVPVFLQPFISCHEVAHQLGYAKEMEANFVGYLAASSSKDTLLHYSVYLDLFLYSNRNLFSADSATARAYAKQLLPEVKDDIATWRNFNLRHRNPFEPVIRWAYGKYLENNQQPHGVQSYDEVVRFLIAYYKKFGKI